MEPAADASGPLYDRMFRRLEKVRWELADIDFGAVDRTRASEETLAFLQVNCQMELSSLYAVRMFLRDFRAWPDFCQFMSVWYYEEMKHYLVMREYLKVFGREPDASRLDALDTELSPGPWPATLAMHYCGELRLGMWYHRWSDEEDEPVLAHIYRLIGNDEFTPYHVAKGAVSMQTKQDAASYGRYGIRVNSVNPNITLTDMARKAWSDPERSAPRLSRMPIGRFLEPDEVAEAIIYLLSPRAGAITDLSMRVDGGFSVT